MEANTKNHTEINTKTKKFRNVNQINDKNQFLHLLKKFENVLKKRDKRFHERFCYGYFEF